MARRGRPAKRQTAEPLNGQIALEPADEEHLDITALKKWLWEAACAIRGATDVPKFKDFILPLVFFKRFSDMFDDEFAFHVKEYEDEELARSIIEADLAHCLKTGSMPIIRLFLNEYPAACNLEQNTGIQSKLKRTWLAILCQQV